MAGNVSMDYQAMLAQLYQKLTANLADYDYEEQAKRRLYDQQLHTGRLGRESSMTNSSINMADRGLNRSGIALQDHVGVNQAYDAKNAEYAGGFNADLASLARKRLEAQTQYNLEKAELERQSALGAALSTGLGGGGGSGGGGGGGGSFGGAPSTPTPGPDYSVRRSTPGNLFYPSVEKKSYPSSTKPQNKYGRHGTPPKPTPKKTGSTPKMKMV